MEKTMRVLEFSTAEQFLEKALPPLEQNEPANNLILGLAYRLIHSPDLYPLPPFLAIVERDGEPVLAALMTPPHQLILSAFSTDVAEGYSLLSQTLRKGRWFVPGVRGPSELVDGFSACWADMSGARQRPGQNKRVYVIRSVTPARPVSGGMRQAGATDLETAARWNAEFFREASGEDNPEAARRDTEFKIRNRELYLWEDGQPRAMAGAIRPTRHWIGVGGVYTPPAARNRGYASALVAALSQRMLDQGYQFVSLFTDLANPTSNKIYQEIGYSPVCDFKEVYFDFPG